ncbi:MAG: hypothetical protein RLZZ244_537, partial [Verrucomicrobiota bacterium]
ASSKGLRKGTRPPPLRRAHRHVDLAHGYEDLNGHDTPRRSLLSSVTQNLPTPTEDVPPSKTVNYSGDAWWNGRHPRPLMPRGINAGFRNFPQNAA